MIATDFKSRGTEIRDAAKQLVLDFMNACPDCATDADGCQQALISRLCGLEWGDYPNATANQQHFWMAGLLRQLEQEGKVQRDISTKKWRLKCGDSTDRSGWS